MKKIIVNLFILVSALLTGFGCDVVKDVKDPNVTIIQGNRKVLVEDYTGHKCGNCPAAADTLRYLEKKYEGKIIPIAIHAGFFATVNPTYPTDFRNTTSNAYDAQFGISAAGNPNGLVNRKGYGTGGFVKAYTVWEGEVAQMLSTTSKFEIKIRNTFNIAGNSVNTRITTKSFANINGNYKLVVLLTEDSIISEQLDYRLPSGSQLISNYNFMHVLRDAVNSSWGDPIFTTGAVVNDSIVKSYNYTVNSSYNAAKCHIVAYIYDADSSSPTYYEVLQAEEEKVK
jgi:thiol-disulfide isomerase/thioredoxin